MEDLKELLEELEIDINAAQCDSGRMSMIISEFLTGARAIIDDIEGEHQELQYIIQHLNGEHYE